MKRPPKAVSFDMDETLVDKEPTGVLAFIEYCGRFGLPVERHHFAQIERFRQKYFADTTKIGELINGMGSKAFWLHYNSLVLEDVLGFAPAEQVVELLTATFAREYRPRVYILDDVRHTLKFLKDRDIPMAIITTRNVGLDLGINLGKVEHELEDLGVAKFFSRIVGLSSSGETKPHSSVFIETAAALNVSISELLHVGNDYYSDYQGALNSGAQAALLDRHEIFDGVPGQIRTMDHIFSLWQNI